MAAIDTRDDDERFPAFAWPGGYRIIYITREGDTLCAACAAKEAVAPTAQTYDEGAPITCDECNVEMDSSYGDPAEDDDVPGFDQLTPETPEIAAELDHLMALEREEQHEEGDAYNPSGGYDHEYMHAAHE